MENVGLCADWVGVSNVIKFDLRCDPKRCANSFRPQLVSISKNMEFAATGNVLRRSKI